MSDKSLHVGDLLVVLFARSHPPDTFHWAICVPITPKEALKFHAKETGGHWFFEDNPVPKHALLSDATVSASIKIGELESISSVNDLQSLFKSIPLAVPVVDAAAEPVFRCRVWLKEAVRQLHAHEYIQCTDVNDLEVECKSLARLNDPSQSSYAGYRYYESSKSH
ncbi:hypothetical protein C8R41DRAFT_954926 [Lentinula lateritia]|uniref:Uncharacterized protein n=1 Tax=Lentinula lateritia TaxID=40482 RepID=A0ABQ8VDB0_9AGAR|nr:hypothetical protein C8R41DRAFT_954926 [Lentinula lateritia]